MARSAPKPGPEITWGMEKAGAAILREELDASPYHAMGVAAAVYRAMSRVAEGRGSVTVQRALGALPESAPQSDLSRPS